MTAFDAAWRKEREDAQASAIQAAYDKVDGYQNWQRWFHVAQPIKTMMPGGEGIMYRDRIGTNSLVDKEGEYISAEQAMADYLEDVKEDIARKRKNPGLNKDPKYARLFIPNPQSKMKEIGDFHLDEGKSEEWQEKNASEPMTAFDTAWDLMKAPYHGTTTDVLPSIMREGIQPRRADPFTPPLVFYTNNPEQAMAFAKIRAEEEGRGEPVLLQFPKSAVEPVPQEPGVRAAQSQAFGYQTTANPIPPEVLQVIEGPKKPSKNILFEEEPYNEWSDKIEQWKDAVRRLHDAGVIE